MNVLVTGASGFLGYGLSRALIKKGYVVTASARRIEKVYDNTIAVKLFELTEETDWTGALNGVDVVIHCAARVHVMNESSADPIDEFRKVNVGGTLGLARQAMNAGVKRFIYISSIKVNGEYTELGRPFQAHDTPKPGDPYGLSKYEAEQGLMQMCLGEDMDVVIIRPPLVYGPGVKANFLNMMRWVYRGIPLPLGAIKNKRSFVSLANLIDLICVCIGHPDAKGQIFLVSDDGDVSTAELLKGMAKAFGVSSRLIPVPEFIIRFGARVVGKPEISLRLCGSLQVDITSTKKTLGWIPPLTMEEGLKVVANTFVKK